MATASETVHARPARAVSLIGMPGAGKSTVGVILAKLTARAFVDTDVLIQTREGRSLQAIVDRDGYQALRRIEEAAILDLACGGHVVATGGSAAYSERAMRHLGAQGRVVFLDVPLPVLERRVTNFASRGIAGPPGMDLAALCAERVPLYRRYADITVDAAAADQETLAARIAALLPP